MLHTEINRELWLAVSYYYRTSYALAITRRVCLSLIRWGHRGYSPASMTLLWSPYVTLHYLYMIEAQLFFKLISTWLIVLMWTCTMMITRPHTSFKLTLFTKTKLSFYFLNKLLVHNKQHIYGSSNIFLFLSLYGILSLITGCYIKFYTFPKEYKYYSVLWRFLRENKYIFFYFG